MEGRPPNFDDDDLDFDFESPRRRHSERLERGTGERPIVDPDDYPSDEYASGERSADYPSEEFPAQESDDPFAEDRRTRRERPRRRGIGGIRIGRRRRQRPDTAERRAREETGERPARDETGERALRDDPYTPADTPVPMSRRARHRDLPAKVRRRQAIGAGAVVAAVLVGGFLLIGGIGGGGGDEEEPFPVKKLVGQSFIGVFTPQGATPELLKRVRKGQLGGLIVKPKGEAQLQAELPKLQQAAEAGDNPPLLVMVDQEGGEVKRLPGPPDIDPAQLGSSGDPETAKSEGEKTGVYLRGLGINVDLAPVLDVKVARTADTIGSRTFGDDPALVSEIGVAFIEGLQSEQVAATAKHFPGLGLATLNTDFAAVEVVGRQEELDAALAPFTAAVDAGVQLVMISSAIYPNYVGDNPRDPNRPAAFAAQIVEGLLRGQLGFEGVVITDDLESIAIKELSNRDEAAVSALNAGVDLVLYARTDQGSQAGFNEAVKAVKKGKLKREDMQAAYDRILSLKETLGSD